ncbi:hypothetical protein COSO111634_26370 [Corallococcus soli]
MRQDARYLLQHLARQRGGRRPRGGAPCLAGAVLRARRTGQREARQGLQLSREEAGATGVALDLPARRLGHGARFEQLHRVHGQLVVPGHLPADGLDDRFEPVGRELRGHLVHDDEPLLAPRLHGERGPGAGTQRRVAPLDGALQVLRVVIEAAQDEQVLGPPRHEELFVPHEPQVAGAQEGALSGLAQRGLERLPGGVRAVPVPARDGRTGDPDFANRPLGERSPPLRIHDEQPPIQRVATGAHQRLSALAPGLHRDGLPALERAAIEGLHPGRMSCFATGHQQGRFGQAVAGQERVAAEAVRPERPHEALQRLRADGLGAVERHAPGGQVQSLALLRRGLAHAQRIGEVRPAAGGGAMAGDGPQPPQRLQEEVRGRHHHGRIARVERLEQAADEPHVVVGRQPRHHLAGARLLEPPADGLQVPQEVLMREHHPLGQAGGAGGVLEERPVRAGERGRRPRVFAAHGERVGGPPRQLLQVGREREELAEQLQVLGPDEARGGPRVLRDGLEPCERAVVPWRVDGHRDHASVEAAEERGDVVEPRRIDEQHALTGGQPAQPGGDPPGAAVQLRARQPLLLGLAVHQEGVQREVRLLPGALPQQAHERVRVPGGILRVTLVQSGPGGDGVLGLAHAHFRITGAASGSTRPMRALPCSRTKGRLVPHCFLEAGAD